MATDITQDWGTIATVTATGLQALANGNSATSGSFDLGNPGPFELSFEFKIMCTGSTATGTVDVFAKWSIDDSDYPGNTNDRYIGSVRIEGATVGLKVMKFPVEAQYAKLRFANNIAGPLATGDHSLTFKPVSINQV